MKQREVNKNRYLAPMIAVILALLLWFFWESFHSGSINMSENTSRNETFSRQKIYFGPSNSIAVLPFSSGYAEVDQAVLSDGFSTELLKLFTRVDNLQVTARTSSFFFRDETLPARLVGERLQSSHLLKGEITQREGRLLVEAWLVKTRDNEELWSQSYEREPAGVFEIQHDILASVLDVMNISYRGELPQVEVTVLAAWEKYLQGEFYRHQRTAGALLSAEEAFKAALERVPDYGPALYGLAETRFALQLAGPASAAGLEAARMTLDSAMKLSPETSELWGLLGFVRHKFDWEWSAAVQAAQHAVDLNPGDAVLMNIASLALFTVGDFKEAERMLKASIKRDPLNLSIRLRLGLLYEFMTDYEQSLAVYRQVATLNPEFPAVHAYRARVKILQEKPDSALIESDEETDEFWRNYSRLLALSALERDDGAEKLMDILLADHGQDAAFQIAEVLAFRGEADLAFEWLHRAREQRDGGLAEMIGNHFLENLHADPRWLELMKSLGHQLD